MSDFSRRVHKSLFCICQKMPLKSAFWNLWNLGYLGLQVMQRELEFQVIALYLQRWMISHLLNLWRKWLSTQSPMLFLNRYAYFLSKNKHSRSIFKLIMIQVNDRWVHIFQCWNIELMLWVSWVMLGLLLLTCIMF